MRRALFLLGPLVCSLAVFACEDSGGGGGATGTFTPEGGTFEAGPSADSAPADSATDAPPPQSGVTVSLLRGTTLVSGIDVVFHDASGAVLETKQTGADGKATSTATLAVAQASVVFGSVGRRHIITWTSVADGDTLVAFDDTTDDLAGSVVANAQGTFTDAGATGLRAFVGECEGFATTAAISVAMQRSCVRAKEAVLAQALDTNGNILGVAFAKAQSAPPSDAGAAPSALGPWLLPANVEVTTQDVPASDFASVALTEIANELPFFNDSGLAGRLPTDPTTFRVAPGFADAYQLRVSVSSSAVPGAVHGFGARVAPAAATTLTYASALPVIDSATLTTTDIVHPQVVWTTAGNVSLATADGGIVSLDWSDQLENAGSWAFVVAPGSKGVVAPSMPAALADYLPHGPVGTMPAVSFAPPAITFAESDLIADYKAFRAAAALSLSLDNRASTDLKPLLPAIGKFELTGYQNIPR